MQTIVLATQKGGSGKSALAIGLALAAIQAGHTVRRIETDSQGSLSNWQSRRAYAEPIVEPVYAANDVEQRLQSLDRDGVTLTIIDTAGGVSATTNSAIRYADLCLIPARPSLADVEATAATLRVIRACLKPFAYVLNQTPIRGAHLSNAESALSEEAARDIADVIAKPFIVMHNDHQDALSAGLAVSEYTPGGKSAEEIRGLWQWIEARLKDATAADEQVVEKFAVSPEILPAMAALTPIENDSALFLRAPARPDTPHRARSLRGASRGLVRRSSAAKAEVIQPTSPAGLLRSAYLARRSHFSRVTRHRSASV
ncbi:ParA family protein [Bradyrhizobium sp. WSM 1791]|uniref:ParA family protein n=1 Tax=Bradyrhizobium australiense TaxID=2721161 RepID=A0A7Y4GPI7_9BRAD|nr:ParA family protein [Bradyrhizobium australiense]